MVASIISGKLYFVNESSGEKLVIAYPSVSVGLRRGLPVGVSWSKKSDPSGDIDNVISVAGRRHFSWAAFPCYGYMIGMGASLAVLGSIGGEEKGRFEPIA